MAFDCERFSREGALWTLRFHTERAVGFRIYSIRERRKRAARFCCKIVAALSPRFRAGSLRLELPLPRRAIVASSDSNRLDRGSEGVPWAGPWRGARVRPAGAIGGGGFRQGRQSQGAQGSLTLRSLALSVMGSSKTAFMKDITGWYWYSTLTSTVSQGAPASPARQALSRLRPG